MIRFGEIDELDALVGLDHDRLTVNRQAADRRDATSSTGFSRTVTVELLLMQFLFGLKVWSVPFPDRTE